MVTSEYVEEGKIVKTIDNVEVLKDAIKKEYPTVSDYELGKSILLALGDSEEFIASTGNIDNSYNHYADATWTSSGPTEPTLSAQAHLNDTDGNNRGLSISTPSLYGIGAECPLFIMPRFNLDRLTMYYGISATNDVTCHVSYAHSILDCFSSFSVDINGNISFSGFGKDRKIYNGTAMTLYHNP